MWVVRPRTHNELGACLAAGVVGLGTQSGIDVDATGLVAGRAAGAVEGAVRTAPGQGPPPAVGVPRRDGARRPGRRCRSSTAPGCCSARWSATTCSRAASCCRTAARPAGTGSCPGRRRCPPATLQDPRALFRVTLDPAALRPSCRRAAARSAAAPGRGRPACRRRRGSGRPARAAGCGPAGSARRRRRGAPAVIGRRKSVLLLTPTANWPRSTHGGARPDAGRGLDDRAVDAAVDDAPRRVLVRARGRRCRSRGCRSASVTSNFDRGDERAGRGQVDRRAGRRSRVPHQAEGVADRVGVDAEVAAAAGQPAGAELEHLRLGLVDVGDPDVEVELLGAVGVGPVRRLAGRVPAGRRAGSRRR